MYTKEDMDKLVKKYCNQCLDLEVDLNFSDWLIAYQIHELTRAITSLKGI